MSAARLASSRSAAIAVLALLRRDLLAGGRAGALRAARAAALVFSGGGVLIAYASFDPGAWRDVPIETTIGIFFTLAFIALLSAPHAAIQALRRERDAGMLELLATAGLTPSRLAAGRIVSTFLNMLSLLLATLPALALLAFFGRPTGGELLACVGIIACAWLALSSCAVGVSAWARSTAAAAALSIGGLIAWSALLGVLSRKGVELGPHALISEMFGLRSAQGLAISRVLIYLAVHVGIALLAWGLAVLGIRSAGGAGKAIRSRTGRPRSARARLVPASLRKLATTRAPLRDGWPLTWLLERHAAARLAWLLILAPPIAMTWKGGHGLAFAAWSLASLTLLLALLVPAFQVNVARERHRWDSVMSTGIDGRRVMIDLVRSALTASSLPALASFLAIMLLALDGPNFGSTGVEAEWTLLPSAVVRSAAACAAFVATWIASAALGLAAGLAARTSAGSVVTCGLAVFLVAWCPAFVYVPVKAMSDHGVGWPWLVALVFGACLLAVSVPVLTIDWLDRSQWALAIAPLAWAWLIAPLFMLADAELAPWFASGGFGGLVAITMEVLPDRVPSPGLSLLFALPHALLALVLLARLRQGADRWLGRPA